jgi:hypothetical protein
LFPEKLESLFMITNESAIHRDSVQAHTLLHIHLESMHLESMAVLSQLEASSKDCSSKPVKQRVHFHKRAWRSAGWVLLTLMLLVWSSGSRAAHAQSTAGSIRGVVQDKAGAVVPDSRITLHSDDEGTDRAVVADAYGAFLLENLKPGHFSLRANHSGFADASLTGIVL